MLNWGSESIIAALIGVGGTTLAALIAGVVSLIAQGRQLKREGKTVESISSDTSDMKPKIDNLDRRSEKQTDKIDILVADVEHRKRLEAAFPQGVSGNELIQAGTKAMLEEYEKLSCKYQFAKAQITEQAKEIRQLRSQNSQLRNTLKEERSRNQPGNNREQDFER